MAPSIWTYANPERFQRLARRLEPVLGAASLASLLAGLWLAFFIAPADYQQGDTVRIMFLHVPAAWMALGIYAFMAGASLAGLVLRHPLADAAAKAAAPIGAVFTAICLVTGALWGRPMWGTFWVWDARLTSVLVLFFLYLGYIALWQAIEDQARAQRLAAILALVGAINLPVIKFSVDWWNTLHQGASVFRADGPSIHPALLGPLFVMAAAFALTFLTLVLRRIRTEILNRRIQALRLAHAGAGADRTGTEVVTA